MKIQAIVIDGYHSGHKLNIEYNPIVKLLKPKIIKIDYCCDGSEFPERDEIITYLECFRSVDQQIVLYSTTGKSQDFFSPDFFDFIYRIKDSYYNRKTVLKCGYYGENYEEIEMEEKDFNNKIHE